MCKYVFTAGMLEVNDINFQRYPRPLLKPHDPEFLSCEPASSHLEHDAVQTVAPCLQAMLKEAKTNTEEAAKGLGNK